MYNIDDSKNLFVSSIHFYNDNSSNNTYVVCYFLSIDLCAFFSLSSFSSSNGNSFYEWFTTNCVRVFVGDFFFHSFFIFLSVDSFDFILLCVIPRAVVANATASVIFPFIPRMLALVCF